MTLQTFIKKRPHLIWYVKNYNHLNDAAIVESVLNYGDWDDVKKIFAIAGIKKVAAIFKKQTTRRKWGRMNYDPKTADYFKLYFKAHA
ncbi:hypothetical protein HY624_02995 [Candidatus Uhrbacteria bacterium]|nr:hypothetical protein [Candidatus Uhrbacteria bacterium]